MDSSVHQISSIKWLARQFRRSVGAIRDAGAEREPAVSRNTGERGVEGNLPVADGGLHPHVLDPRCRRRRDEIDIPAESLSRHGAFHLSRRRRVGVREHHALDRQGLDTQAQLVLLSRLHGAGEIKVATGKSDCAGPFTIQVNRGQGVEPFHVKYDASARPPGRHLDCALVPGGRHTSQVLRVPGRVAIDTLRIFLKVIVDAGPTSRDLEIPPIRLRDRRIVGAEIARGRGLPPPKPIEADSLSSRSGLPASLVHVPNHLNPWRQRHPGLHQAHAPKENCWNPEQCWRSTP